MFDIPTIHKYRCSVIGRHLLPFDTGNLAFNAATLQVFKPGFRWFINTAEADYTEDVFEYYLYKRGTNFMYNIAFAMYNYLQKYYNGGRPHYDKEYMQARRSVALYSSDSEQRQIRNVLHGTGQFADKTLKAQILETGGK